MVAHKINRKTPKFNASLSIKQFPWNLAKMIRFKRRKWLKVKFSTRFSSLKKKGNVINFRFFRTYKNKIKKLFKIYFAPKFTDRQCQKLLRFNSRYKATFKKLLNIESRADTLVFRLYMVSSLALARELIKKNYFLLNGKTMTLSTMNLNVGDILSTSNLFAWHFLYQNMLKTVSSLLKYFSRLFVKFSFPFIIKRKNFHLKEYGKFKNRTLKLLNPAVLNRLTTRKLFLRYKKIKETTTSKIKPAKKYYFTKGDSKAFTENFKLKRLKAYILKKTKTNLTLALQQALFKPYPQLKARPRGLGAYQLLTYNKNVLKKNKNKKLRRQLDFLKSLTFAAKQIQALTTTLTRTRANRKGRRAKRQMKLNETPSSPHFVIKGLRVLTKSKKLLIQILSTSNSSKTKKQTRYFKARLKKKKRKIITSIRKLPNIFASARRSQNSVKTHCQSPLSLGKDGADSGHAISASNTVRFKNFLLSAGNRRKLANPNKLRRLGYTFSHSKSERGVLIKQQLNTLFNKKTTHFKMLFVQTALVTRKVISHFCLKSRRPKKPFWRRWVPKNSNNFWQVNRLTKKNLYLFRYLKKFNNKYKQYSYFQNLKQNAWAPILRFRGEYTPVAKGWQKTSLLLEKKKRKLLTCQLAKSIVFGKKNIKSLFIYKNYILRPLSESRFRGEQLILRVKRKFLRLKGFFRQYKTLKIHVKFAEQNQVYTPICIQYKQINLLFKNRPIAYYFVEANYNDLEFTIVADVDFLFFPYKFYCNQ